MPGSGSGPNSLIGAATRVTSKPSVRKSARNTPGWAAAAWDFYDTVGEFRYAADWVGAMLSKARLYVTDTAGVRLNDGPAFEILDALYGGQDEQSEMLKAFGTHLTVAGDSYLLGTVIEGDEQWQVVSSTALSARGGKYYISGKQVETDSGTDPYLMRLWRPHPRNFEEANSPARAVLPILSEIDGLTKHVAAQVDSRLTSSGVLWAPSEMTFPSKPHTEGDETSRQPTGAADQFIQNLIDIASIAREDPESAAAKVPLVVTAPGEYLENVQYMTFWTELDENAIQLRSEAIRRLALGLDMPPEVMTGAADVNHWNMWAVDEAAIKVHAEPALQLIANSLTTGYLRPLLAEEIGADQAKAFQIVADTSGIRLRPNRSEEAIELYDRGELSSSALRRETGFDSDDAPPPQELTNWFIRKVASGSTTPELVAQALQLLGAPFDTPTDTEAPTTEARPTPSLEDHPSQDPPDQDESESPLVADAAPAPDHSSDPRRIALQAAAEQMVFRALERAGNRLKTKLNGSRPPGVSSSELYLFVPCTTGTVDRLLTDAWTHVPRFADSYACCADELSTALDSYCRAIITEQRPHSPELLETYLNQVQVS